MRVVVSDTSPIRYLALIEQAELLKRMYGQVFIPDVVHRELQQKRTPGAVGAWMEAAPPWLHIVREFRRESEDLVSSNIDRGERAAIAIAIDFEGGFAVDR